MRPVSYWVHAAAFMQAAKELKGAAVSRPRRTRQSRNGQRGMGRLAGDPLTGHPAAMAALKEAELVIDLVFMLFSKEQLEIQASGTRILLAVEPADVLTRLLPTGCSYASRWSSWSRLLEIRGEPADRA